jgi:methyltransferase (TIGR00027 family)
MQPGKASRTAELMAFFRALESARPARCRLFADPFARGCLRPSLRLVVTLSRVPLLGALVLWFIDRAWPGVRHSGIARTRLIDDMLATALGDGIDQLVIVGAGFDGRAYRLHDLQRAHVFEIDHPQTSAVKRQFLRHSLKVLPGHVTFLEVDIEHQELGHALASSRFDAARRAFFLCEGVLDYLTEQAVDRVIRIIGGTAPGSQVLFTYLHRGLLDGSAEFGCTGWIGQTLRRLGEVWVSGLYPHELAGYLRARGLRLIEDMGSRDYRARYLTSDRRALRGFEFSRAALAQVQGLVATKTPVE